MARTAVVTDSTADLPSDLAEVLGIRVVPMTVTFGEESYTSRITLGEERFYELLEERQGLPTTSQPVPAWFEEAYADADDDGADGVVSIHVSGALSGTVDQARRVAEHAPLPVEVVDSGQVSGTLALAVLAAQATALEGGSVGQVAAAARKAAAAARLFVVVDTLEYMKRGGRLSGTQALVGTALRVKPILTIEGGEVVVLERTRTWSRARDRLVDLAVEAVEGGAADVVVTHALAADRAGEVADLLAERLDVRERLDTTIGPVVGTHCGPGTVAIAVAPAADAEPIELSADLD